MQSQTTEGVALQLWAPDLAGGNATAHRVQDQVFDLLARGLPVGLTVAGIDNAAGAAELFANVCELIAAAMHAAEAAPELVTIAVTANSLSPEQLWAVRSKALGNGCLYLLVDGELARPSVVPARRRHQEDFWMQCWRLRSNWRVRTALAPIISSPCPLFALEKANGILPSHSLQVPTGSAWAVMPLDLMDLANQQGEIDHAALSDTVRSFVERGDQRHNKMDWPTAAMCHDSWYNRRLAILLGGIGDLVRLRQLDPQCLTTLRQLDELVQQIRLAADTHSRRLAADGSHAPGLKLGAPDRQAAAVVEMAGWQKRWQAALDFTATRHRNLLAVSPWAVFPGGATADSRYAELLPLLARADVCAFPAAPRINSWNINEFKYFHHRLWAILEAKDEQQTIAEQV